MKRILSWWSFPQNGIKIKREEKHCKSFFVLPVGWCRRLFLFFNSLSLYAPMSDNKLHISHTNSCKINLTRVVDYSSSKDGIKRWSKTCTSNNDACLTTNGNKTQYANGNAIVEAMKKANNQFWIHVDVKMRIISCDKFMSIDLIDSVDYKPFCFLFVSSLANLRCTSADLRS